MNMAGTADLKPPDQAIKGKISLKVVSNGWAKQHKTLMKQNIY